MNIWEIVSKITSADTAILYLDDSKENGANPFLGHSLEDFISSHNQKAGEESGFPYIPPKAEVYSFTYLPQSGNFIQNDPHEAALGQLLRYMGAGESVTPDYGYHLFSHGRAIGFSREKTVMEGEAIDVFLSLTKSIFKKGSKSKSELQRLSAKPLARHFYNILSDYYLREKEDAISRLRREGREGKSLALGTALAFFGLDPSASKEEISKARKKLLQRSHPDLAGNDKEAALKGEELSRRINQTYEYIMERMGG